MACARRNLSQIVVVGSGLQEPGQDAPSTGLSAGGVYKVVYGYRLPFVCAGPFRFLKGVLRAYTTSALSHTTWEAQVGLKELDCF